MHARINSSHSIESIRYFGSTDYEWSLINFIYLFIRSTHSHSAHVHQQDMSGTTRPGYRHWQVPCKITSIKTKLIQDPCIVVITSKQWLVQVAATSWPRSNSIISVTLKISRLLYRVAKRTLKVINSSVKRSSNITSCLVYVTDYSLTRRLCGHTRPWTVLATVEIVTNWLCCYDFIIIIIFVIIWLDKNAQSALKVAQQCAIKSKT